mmetsp:Transcript_97397/g.303316  ORF Transcript_97397/g.303316 Transcript_97397/m.303316 type:complete len:265 (-) Transcript_97397:374-1168(-)
MKASNMAVPCWCLLRSCVLSTPPCPPSHLRAVVALSHNAVGAHSRYLPDAGVLLRAAVAKVLAQEVEVLAVDPLHQRSRLVVQISRPDLRAAGHVQDVGQVYAHLGVAVLGEDLVDGGREVAVVDGQSDPVGSVEVFGLRDEYAVVAEGVGPRQVHFHHVLDGLVHVARLKGLLVTSGVACAVPAEDGHQPLVGVAQNAEALPGAKVRRGQVHRPVLGRREVERAAGEARRQIPELRAQEAPRDARDRRRWLRRERRRSIGGHA